LLIKVAAGQDWTSAILDTIPMRKGAKAKTTNGKEVQEVEQEQRVEQTEEKLEAELKNTSIVDIKPETKLDSLDS